MSRDLITIENAWICRLENSQLVPVFGDIIIENGKIAKIRQKDFELFRRYPQQVHENSVNACGKMITLPLVNFHDHIYSRLAKGLPLKVELNNFQKILHDLWWKLDKALDPDMIKASAEIASMDAIKNGVAYIFDHHSSPGSIEGSLSIIKNAMKEFGLRGVLCYETTDRNGAQKTTEAMNENLNFIATLQDEDFLGMLGLHASFTLSDDTLFETQKQLGQNDTGIHMHVSEDRLDNKLSRDYTGLTPVRRLKKFKLMNAKSLLVHGVYLSEKDYGRINEAGAALVFCPDSNLNNSVGFPQLSNVPESVPILPGTDGMHSNIAKTIKNLYLHYRSDGNSIEKSLKWIERIYYDQMFFVRRYFQDYPSLSEGDRADMIIWDYVPPTPVDEENFWGHFVYGLLESNVRSVINKGEFILRDFKFTGIDEDKIRNEVSAHGRELYLRLLKNN